MRVGAASVDLTAALAKTVILLAARGGPVLLRELAQELGVSNASVHTNMSRLRDQGIRVVQAGRGETGKYQLPAGCLIDAEQFVRGVDGQDIDTLLSLWRGPVPRFPGFLEKGLDSPPWATVKAARSRLIRRISGLSEADRRELAGLAGFVGLFPGDQEVDAIRLSAPDARPCLLVVEDQPDMMRQISKRLDASYEITPLSNIDEWFDFRDNNAAQLSRIQGALIDLSLTCKLNDKEGLAIVTHLRDKTSIAVALVTANSLESTEFEQRERMALYRLVDIVNKNDANWYNALENTAKRLVGSDVPERRTRMETWLNAAHQKVMMETSDSDPESVEGRYRRARHSEWASLLGRVHVDNVEDMEAVVRRFCASCRTPGPPPPVSGSPALPIPGRGFRSGQG